jgi:hypothetical protein
MHYDCKLDSGSRSVKIGIDIILGQSIFGIALSVSEMVILRRVLKPALIATFVGVAGAKENQGRDAIKKWPSSVTNRNTIEKLYKKSWAGNESFLMPYWSHA